MSLKANLITPTNGALIITGHSHRVFLEALSVTYCYTTTTPRMLSPVCGTQENKNKNTGGATTVIFQHVVVSS